MKQRFDFDVIGSGLAGLLAAWYLKKCGKRVRVFFDPLVSGASSAALGVCAAKGRRIPKDPLFKLKYWGSISMTLLLDELSALDRSLCAEHGILEPYFSASDYQKISRRVFAHEFRGLFATQSLSENPSKIEFFDQKGFLSYPCDIFLDPVSFLKNLKKHLNSQGVFFEGRKIERIDWNSNAQMLLVCGDEDFLTLNPLIANGAQCPKLLENSQISITDWMISEGYTEDFYSREVERRAFLWHQEGLVFWDGCLRSLCKKEGNSSFFAKLKSPKVSKAFRKNFGERLRQKSRLPLFGEIQLPENKKILLLTGFYKSGFQTADIAARLLVSQVCRNDFLSFLPKRIYDELSTLFIKTRYKLQ